MEKPAPPTFPDLASVFRKHPTALAGLRLGDATRFDRVLWGFGHVLKAIGGNAAAVKRLRRKGITRKRLEECRDSLASDERIKPEALDRAGDWGLDILRPMVAQDLLLVSTMRYLDDAAERLANSRESLRLGLVDMPDSVRELAILASDCLILALLMIYTGIAWHMNESPVRGPCIRRLARRLRCAARRLRSELMPLQSRLVCVSEFSCKRDGAFQLTAHHAALAFGQLVADTEAVARADRTSYLFVLSPGTVDWSDHCSNSEDAVVAEALASLPISEDPSDLLGEIHREALAVAVASGNQDGKIGQLEGNDGASATSEGLKVRCSVERTAILQGLRPAHRKAYLAFQYAESKAGKPLQDHEAYERLEAEDFGTVKDDFSELTDYDLPCRATWTRQVRYARNAIGDQKYTRRSGRCGRSIVAGREIEYQRGGDE